MAQNCFAHHQGLWQEIHQLIIKALHAVFGGKELAQRLAQQSELQQLHILLEGILGEVKEI